MAGGGVMFNDDPSPETLTLAAIDAAIAVAAEPGSGIAGWMRERFRSARPAW